MFYSAATFFFFLSTVVADVTSTSTLAVPVPPHLRAQAKENNALFVPKDTILPVIDLEQSATPQNDLELITLETMKFVQGLMPKSIEMSGNNLMGMMQSLMPIFTELQQKVKSIDIDDSDAPVVKATEESLFKLMTPMFDAMFELSSKMFSKDGKMPLDMMSMMSVMQNPASIVTMLEGNGAMKGLTDVFNNKAMKKAQEELATSDKLVQMFESIDDDKKSNIFMAAMNTVAYEMKFTDEAFESVSIDNEQLQNVAQSLMSSPLAKSMMAQFIEAN